MSASPRGPPSGPMNTGRGIGLRQAVPRLEVCDLRKVYGETVALHNATFTAYAGEVLGVVGQNGAGKSTLMRIIAGLDAPTSGTVQVDGTRLTDFHSRTAQHAGVHVVQQELSLVEHLTAAENIFLGEQVTNRLGLVDRRKTQAMAAQALEQVGAPPDIANRLVAELSPSERQLTEIARATRGHCGVLLLDEPTASLGSVEVSAVFRTVRALKAQGVLILYVSHMLDEVLNVSDRVLALRDGRASGPHDATGMSKSDLARLILGGEVQGDNENTGERSAPQERPPALVLTDLCAGKLRNISLRVAPGEVVGIGGLMGAGKTTLGLSLVGLHPIASGSIAVNGRPMGRFGPQAALRVGIAYVPPDRGQFGLFPDMDLVDNLWAGRLPTTGGFVPRRKLAAKTREVLEGFLVRFSHVTQTISKLSGGNQQKIVVARAYSLTPPPLVVVLDEPTRGVDVGARRQIYSIIHAYRGRGVATLVMSNDAEELAALCDRVVILSKGTVQAELEHPRVREVQRTVALS